MFSYRSYLARIMGEGQARSICNVGRSFDTGIVISQRVSKYQTGISATDIKVKWTIQSAGKIQVMHSDLWNIDAQE